MADIFIEQRIDHLEDLIADVWRAFAETDRRLDERFAETDRRLDERFAETDRRMDERFAETDRRMDERFERIEHSIELAVQERREATKKWGELSNKMGTLVEDFVSPSIPRILHTVLDCREPMEMTAIRLRRRHPVDRDRTREFDAVAVCGEYVLINETKSSLNSKDVDDFVELMSQVRDFFPEYAGLHFIGAIASLHVDESVVRYGQKQGLLMLGLSDTLIEVLNESGFDPKRF